jgi:uncharacterized protein YlxW (UPF0749 family)
MFWNATMPVWVALAFIVPIFLLAIAGWLKAWETSWNASKREHRLIEKREEAYAQCNQLNTEIEHLDKDLQEAQATIHARDLEIERLHKPDLATLPLQEAVKPPTRKKRGEQQ